MGIMSLCNKNNLPMKNPPRWLLGAMLMMTAFSQPVNGQSVKTWLDGSGSDGCDTSHWRQISGFEMETIVLSHPDSIATEATFTRPGMYDFELRCRNEYGEDRDTMRVTVMRNPLGIEDDRILYDRPKNLDITMLQQGSNLRLHFRSPQSTKITVQISDMIGRVVYRGEMSIRAGDSDAVIPLNFRGGVYAIVFISKKERIVRKIILPSTL